MQERIRLMWGRIKIYYSTIDFDDPQFVKGVGQGALMAVLLLIVGYCAVSCRTLTALKQEAASVEKELADAIDTLGAEMVREVAFKAKREIARVREKLPEKIKAEIYRAAERYIGIKWNPLSEKEKAQVAVYVAEMKKTEAFREIAAGNVPVTKAGDDPSVVNRTQFKWEPAELLRRQFLEAHPKMKRARKELRWTMMALWEMNLSFLCYYSYRTCEKQKKYYSEGKSKINQCVEGDPANPGMHNHDPSNAVDCVPIKGTEAQWSDRQQMAFMAGGFRLLHCTLANQHGWTTAFRWGGDWDRDKYVNSKGFRDPFHYELRNDIAQDCDRLL